MAKISGVIGYGITSETTPGVWEECDIERKFYGDLTKNTSKSTNSGNVNNDITVSQIVSFVADAYAFKHFMFIKYINWCGVPFTVESVEVSHPRLILTIGGVYK